MPTYSEVTLTFIEDFVVSDEMFFSTITDEEPPVSIYNPVWVVTRSIAEEVTTGTPTGTAGERTAINLEVAFDLDNPIGYVTTQTGNQLVIQSETLGEIFYFVSGTGNVVVTYNNFFPVPDISTIDFGLVRSPYYINIPFGDDTTTAATINLFVWDGDITTPPATANYIITQVRPTTDYTELNADLSKLARESINALPQIDVTLPTQILNNNADAVKWVQYVVEYTDAVTTIADIEGQFLAIDGYGLYSEGANPNKPANDVLTDVAFRKVDRNGFILFPFANVGNITSIDIDSDLGTINASETITSGVESTEAVQYLCIDTSQAVTDEYITITIQPAGDTYVYEIVDECRYNPKQIIFKNRYGLFEVLTMFKKSNETLEVDNKMFINNYISGGTYDTTKHQFQKINIQGKKSIKLNSGYLNQSENVLYEQMLLSDKLYFYENNVLVPINATSSNIEFKTRVNDKLVQYSMEFEYAYNQIQNV